MKAYTRIHTQWVSVARSLTHLHIPDNLKHMRIHTTRATQFYKKTSKPLLPSRCKNVNKNKCVYNEMCMVAQQTFPFSPKTIHTFGARKSNEFKLFISVLLAAHQFYEWKIVTLSI